MTFLHEGYAKNDIMMKPHHVMVKPHHIMTKPHHIYNDKTT